MKIRRFNENEDFDITDDDTNWTDIFIEHTASGKRWKEIFGEEFDKHKFLSRSDATTIVKRAIIETILKCLHSVGDKMSDSERHKLMKHLHDAENMDISALGM